MVKSGCKNARLFFYEPLVLFIGFLLFFSAGNAPCKSLNNKWGLKSGPISIVNQSPIQLLFLQAVPDRAETLQKNKGLIKVNTTITNTLLSEQRDDYKGIIDLEMIRTSIDICYGILPGLEIGVSLPFAYSYSGFMDYSILDEEKGFPCISARVAVKIPTGDEQRAMGSGKPDIGVGLLIQKNRERITYYLNADLIFPGDAFKSEDISVSEFYQLMFGATYDLTSRLSFVTQLNYVGRPFDDTNLKMLGRKIYDITIGFNYLTEGAILIQAGGIEDIFDSIDAGADITFFLNVGKYF